jgi:GntR family transcriptional regulator
MTIKLFLSQTDTRPMYLQIMAQIKQKVMVGDWQAGYHLPSIREMAAVVGVSVITVKRAYLELEREGVIYTQQGRGSFIAEAEELSKELKFAELDEKISQVANAAQQIGLSHSETIDRVNAQLALTKDFGKKDETK